MKKHLTMRILALVMILILLSVSAVGEGTKLKMAGCDDENGNHNWATNLFFQRMEERTGIGFEFEQFTDYSKWTARKQGILDGADVPDVLFKAELTDDEIIALHEAGILIDLKPYIEEYAPNLYALLQEHPEYEQAITLPDGAIAALPCVNMLQNNDAMWINQTWLTNLGLETPTTADELTEVLRAFKTGDPNQNGKADEIPLNFIGMWDLRFLSHAFGIVTNDYYLSVDAEGKVNCPIGTDEYRAFLQWLNDLWNENLLYHDGFSITDSMRQITEENAVMVSGMFFTPTPIMLVPTNAISQYAVLMPMKYNGQRIYRDLFGNVVRGTFAITSQCAEPEKMMAWVDYLYSREGSTMALYGLENTEYVWNENGYWIWNDTMENVANVVLPDATIGEGGALPGYVGTEFQTKYAEEVTRSSVEQLAELKTYCVLPVPQMTMQTETMERINALQAEIGPYAEQTLAAFVNGDTELNDENWEAFRNGLEERGMSEMIELWQTAVDTLVSK